MEEGNREKVWGYLKDINRRTIILVSPVNVTRGKGSSQLDILDNWLKNCMKTYASMCNYIISLLSVVLVIFLR